MGIHSLPLEVVEMIYHHLDPLFHLDLALVDKQVFNLSRHIIEKHQKYYYSYRTFSDQEPAAILRQLRNVATDNVAAWHLRTFEGLNSYHKCRLTGHVSEAKLAALAETVCKTLGAIGIPAFGISQIRNGNLEALETGLLALSSRVHTVKTISLFPPPNQDKLDEITEEFWASHRSSQDYAVDPTRNFFCNAIRAFHEMKPEPLWPPGFESLHTVMITVPHRDFYPPDFERYSGLWAINVAPVFLLPNIRKIYLGGLWINEADVNDDDPLVDPDIPGLGLPSASSSVEHLFIERAGNEEYDGEYVKHAVNAFIDSAKALRTFIVKDCGFNDFDNTIGWLGERHGETLKTLIFGDEIGELRGYRCSKFRPEEVIDLYHCVTIMTLDIGDILLGSMTMEIDREEEEETPKGNNGGASSNWEGRSDNCGSHARSVEFFQYCVPNTTEVLVLRPNRWQRLRGGDFKAIASGIVALLESNVVEMEGLRHVYLDEVLDCADDTPTPKLGCPPGPTGPALARHYFEKIVEACTERGIELHLDSGSTSRYIDKVCKELFDLELKAPPLPGSEGCIEVSTEKYGTVD